MHTGMDFPENAITNVHKIDGIHSIRWALYAPVEDVNLKSPNINRRNGLDSNQVMQLRSLEYELRSNEYHVLYDVDRASIWVFDLPSPGSTPGQKATPNEEVLQVSNRFGMKRTHFDSLKASDLHLDSGIGIPAAMVTKAVASAQAGLIETQRINAQVLNSNPASGTASDLSLLDSSSSSVGVPTIISNMGQAISASIVFSLASNKSLSPIDGRSCIESVFPRDSPWSKNEVLLEHLKLRTSLSLIRVQWSPFGTLTISVSQKLIPGLQRVSEILGDNANRAGLGPTSKILVSPSGQVFQYFRELETSPHYIASAAQPSSYHLFKAKETITSHLALQGIHITPEEKWLLLQKVIKSSSTENIHDESKESMCSVNFLWPARLCFSKIDGFGHGQVWSQEYINTSIERDPLVWAQSWFEGKARREEAIEAKRKDDELISQRLKEAQKIDLEENLYDFTTQDFSEQDAGRFFPAPPDGFRSQAEASANDAEKKAPGVEFVDRDTPDDAERGGAPAGSPFDVVLGPNPTSRYEERDDADLFEEMDSGLFAANGLTEADFSFFDEPSIDAEPDLQDDLECSSAPSVNQEITESALVSHGSILCNNVLGDISGIAVAGVTLVNKESKARQVDKDQFSNSPEELLYYHQSNLSHDGPHTPMTELFNPSTHPSRPEGEAKSTFDAVLFRDQFQEFDGKYVIRGRFGYEHDSAPVGPMVREHLNSDRRIIPRIGLAHEEDTESQETIETSYDQELDHTDDDANTDVSSPLQGEAIYAPVEDNGMPESRKRRRDQEEPITHSSPCSVDDQIEESIYYPGAHLFAASSKTGLDMSLGAWSQILDSNTPYYYGKDRAFIQVAQILVDQLILQTEQPLENAQISEVYNYQSPAGAPNQDHHAFRDIIWRIFPLSEPCNLGQYASIEREIYEARNFGTQHPQKVKSLPPKPKSPGTTRNSLVKSQTPYACVRRNQTSIDLLASALRFWEELGLEPSHESKNISAFYIFPAGDNTKHGVEMFSRMIGNTYQNCKLGIHADFSDLGNYPKGLVPVSMLSESIVRVILQLTTTCEKLGKDMAQLKAQGGNTVIYMVNPFKNPHALAHICAAFSKLFESYSSALKALHVDKPNDLILQIIPRDFIASATTIVLPSPADYKRLAFEVYDRCGPSESVQLDRSGFFCAPSIRLARTMPKRIDLKLSREPSAGLLSSDMCFHMAYSWDLKQHWLTASWTDNQGDLQWNAPYCLGYAEEDDDGPWTVLLAIMKEIWDTTLEMLSPGNSPWRLFIVKDSPMLKRELEILLSICTQPSHPSVTVTILTIDSNPPLQFHPSPPSTIHLPATTSTAQTVDTPTTPITDPTHPTPTDPSAKLIDITDSTWHLILPNFLTDLLLPRQICRSLMSGYLLKRGGVRDENGLIPAQVHLMHVPPTAQKAIDYEALLEEVLGMYAALGTLARLRRIVDPVRSVVPWHVAAARKANAGVNAMMRWKRD